MKAVIDTNIIFSTLFLNIPLVTRDKKLINGLKEKGFEKVIPLESIFTDSNDES